MDMLHKAKSQVKSLGRGVLSAAGLDSAWAQRSATLQVKSYPPPTASVTARYGIKHGYLRKKNEQGTFHRRYCVLVPHLFLYYYENDSSDTPRGIIDLDFYTDTVEDGGLGFHVTAGESHFREFFFEVEREQDLNPWMAAINRDRYHVIREERDAYMQLQETFMGQQEQNDQVLEAERESARKVRLQLDQGNALNKVLIEQLCAISLKAGTNEEDVQRCEWTPEQIQALGSKVQQMMTEAKQSFTTETTRQAALIVEKDEIIRHLEDQLADLNARFQSQSEALAAMAMNLDEHIDVVRRVKAERDAAVTSLEVETLEKKEYAAKNTELSEQRRALVKEVKALRKQAAEDKTANAQLMQVNQEMAAAYERLLFNFRELQDQHAKLSRSLSGEAPVSPHKPAPIDIPVLAPEVLQAAKDGAGIPVPNPGTPVSPNDGSVKYRDLLTGEFKRNASSEVPSAAATGAAGAASSSSEHGGTNESQSLSDLMSSKFRAFKHDVKQSILKDKSQSTASADDFGGAAQLQPQSSSGSGGSGRGGGMFKDFFASIPTSGSHHGGSSGKLSGLLSEKTPTRRGSETQEELSSEHGDASTTSAQTCRRCGGTVEGPQYSTCTCPEPLLLHDGEERGTVGIKKFFTKSKMKFSSLFNSNDHEHVDGADPSNPDNLLAGGVPATAAATSTTALAASASAGGAHASPRKKPVPLLDLDEESDDGSEDSAENASAKQVRMDAIFLR